MANTPAFGEKLPGYHSYKRHHDIRFVLKYLVLFLIIAASLAVSQSYAAFESPLKQTQAGVPSDEIRCNDDRVLVIFQSGRPACIFETTAQRLGLDPIEPSTNSLLANATVIHAADADPVTPPEIATANNNFAVDFYSQISDGDDNMFFSPISMYTAFSMLYEGAQNNTAEEMQQTFAFEPDQIPRHNSTAHLISSINRDDPDATLDMANSLWLADWFVPYESYTDVVRSTYLAEIESVDFLDASDAGGVPRINAWANEKTHGKIPKVLKADDVKESTAAVLLNAIYFKGTWKTQFFEESTLESDFWTSPAQSVRTDFMNMKGFFDMAQLDNLQVLKLPYKGDRLSMLIILPSDRDGIQKIEETLASEQIGQWRQSMQNTEVEIKMPKFEMKTHYDLIPHLKNLGMADAFDMFDADFSGIQDVSSGNLFVSKAIQDAYVKVNEEGTEAAAVTTIVQDQMMLPEVASFVADHPFLFVIQDDESGMVLFMGRVSDPS